MSQKNLQNNKDNFIPDQKATSDHSSVKENNNTSSYTKEEITVISMFQVLRGVRELCKPENKKRLKIEVGQIIENEFYPGRNLIFSTSYIQKRFSVFTLEEIEYLLKLCRISGEMLELISEEGVKYWGYSPS
jgi:hypothetical protein